MPCVCPASPSAQGTSALTSSARHVHFLLLCLAEPSFAGVAAHCRCRRFLRHCLEPVLPCRAQCCPLPVSSCPEPTAEPWPNAPLRTQSTATASHQPYIYLSPALPLQLDWTTTMVRTRGGHRYRPRVRFSIPEIDDVGTSRAADAHSLDQATETPPTLPPAATSEEVQALEPHPGDIRPGWDLGPLLQSLETTQEGPALQASPNIRPDGVFEISARAVASFS